MAIRRERPSGGVLAPPAWLPKRAVSNTQNERLSRKVAQALCVRMGSSDRYLFAGTLESGGLQKTPPIAKQNFLSHHTTSVLDFFFTTINAFVSGNNIATPPGHTPPPPPPPHLQSTHLH